MTKKALVAVAAAMVATAGCGEDGSGGGAQGGVLRVGTHDTTGSLNMFIGGEYGTYKKIYPTLLRVDVETRERMPYLATSWKASDDRRTWTFRIRPDAKWSDGQPLTAQDVAFTYNTIVKFSKGPTAGWAVDVQADGGEHAVTAGPEGAGELDEGPQLAA